MKLLLQQEVLDKLPSRLQCISVEVRDEGGSVLGVVWEVLLIPVVCWLSREQQIGDLQSAGTFSLLCSLHNGACAKQMPI